MASIRVAERCIIQHTKLLLFNPSILRAGVGALDGIEDSVLNVTGKAFVVGQVDVVHRAPDIRLSASGHFVEAVEMNAQKPLGSFSLRDTRSDPAS